MLELVMRMCLVGLSALLLASCSKEVELEVLQEDTKPQVQEKPDFLDQLALSIPNEEPLGDEMVTEVDRALRLAQKEPSIERQAWKFARRNLNDRLMEGGLFARLRGDRKKPYHCFKEITGEVNEMEITDTDKRKGVDWSGTFLLSAASERSEVEGVWSEWSEPEGPIWEVTLRRESGQWVGEGRAPASSPLAK